jgi:hypothetical protein
MKDFTEEKDFYGIGYFCINGDFIFSLLTEEMIKTFPIRKIYAKEWSGNEYDSFDGKIISKIERLN